MPRISYFYGIAVYMYYDDHAPPHLHIRYAEHEAKVLIEGGAVLVGSLPRRALKLVRVWLDLHQVEVMERWENARIRKPLAPIEPLP